MNSNIYDNLLFKNILDFFLDYFFLYFKQKANGPILFRKNKISGYIFDLEKLTINPEYKKKLTQDEINTLNEILSILKNYHFGFTIKQNYIQKFKNNNLFKICKLFTLLSKLNIDKGFYSKNYILLALQIFYAKDIEYNTENIKQITKNLLENISHIDISFRYIVYWESFHLFPYKLISLEELSSFFKKSISLDPNNPYLLLDYARLLGIHLYNISHNIQYIDVAEHYIKKGFIILGKKHIRGYMYSWLGCIYRHKGDFKKALFYIEKGIQINKKEYNIYELAYTWKLSILGVMGEYKKQIEFGRYLEKEKIELYRVYKNLASAYISLKNKNNAFYYLKKCLFWKLCEEPIVVIDNQKYIYLGTSDFAYTKENIQILDYENMIKFISEKYDKLQIIGGVHFIETYYLEKYCNQYCKTFF